MDDFGIPDESHYMRKIHGIRIHEKLEEYKRQGSPYVLPGHITAAVDAVNLINTYGGISVRFSSQCSRRAIMETVDALLDIPIPMPEPRNWYKEYMYPWTKSPVQREAIKFAFDYFTYGHRWPDKHREAARGVRGRWQD